MPNYETDFSKLKELEWMRNGRSSALLCPNCRETQHVGEGCLAKGTIWITGMRGGQQLHGDSAASGHKAINIDGAGAIG